MPDFSAAKSDFEVSVNNLTNRFNYTYFPAPNHPKDALDKISVKSAGTIGFSESKNAFKQLPGKHSIDSCIRNAAHLASASSEFDSGNASGATAGVYMALQNNESMLSKGDNVASYACYLAPFSHNKEIAGKLIPPAGNFDIVTIWESPEQYAEDGMLAMDESGGVYVASPNAPLSARKYMNFVKVDPIRSFNPNEDRVLVNNNINFMFLRFDSQGAYLGLKKTDTHYYKLQLASMSDIKENPGIPKNKGMQEILTLDSSFYSGEKKFLASPDDTDKFRIYVDGMIDAIGGDHSMVSMFRPVARLIMEQGKLKCQITIRTSLTPVPSQFGDDIVISGSGTAETPTNLLGVMKVEVGPYWDKMHLVDQEKKLSAIIPSSATELADNSVNVQTFFKHFPPNLANAVPDEDKTLNSCLDKCISDPTCTGVYKFRHNNTPMCKPINQSSSADYIFTNPIFNAEQPSEIKKNSISRPVLQLRGKQLTAESSPQMSIAIKEGTLEPVQQLGQSIQKVRAPGPVFSNTVFDPRNPAVLPDSMKDDLSSLINNVNQKGKVLMGGASVSANPGNIETLEVNMPQQLKSLKERTEAAQLRNGEILSTVDQVDSIYDQIQDDYTDADAGKNMGALYDSVHGTESEETGGEMKQMETEFQEGIFRTNLFTMIIVFVLLLLAAILYAM
jgi:hypothetical protein